jgi:hypothetical protein
MKEGDIKYKDIRETCSEVYVTAMLQLNTQSSKKVHYLSAKFG